MSEKLKEVLCIRALADDLKFLNPVTNRMSKLLGANLRICELGKQSSHAEAMIALNQRSFDMAVFFAHGGSNYLRGGEYHLRTTGETIETEKFLTSANLEVFCDKVIFCMSCDSNGLAKASLDSGALAFIGFDKVPFNRFDEKGDPIGSSVLIKHCQAILADSVKMSLERFFRGLASLDESVDYLRIILVKRAIEYVRKNTSVKERREIAALILQTKSGLCYHGKKGIFYSDSTEE